MANVVGKGSGVSGSYREPKKSVDELIGDLVDTARQVIHKPNNGEASRRAVVLRGGFYRQRVRRALERNQVVVVDCRSRREAIERGYHLIELDAFFSCHGY